MSFLVITDFTGECNISQNRYAKADYDSIIADTEEKILRDLLGADLYLKLMADLSGGVPQTQKYIDLVNGKTYTVTNAEGVVVNVDYKGLKPMLKYFTHANLVRSQDSQNTEVGQVEPVQENSQRMSKNRMNLIIQTSYNKGFALYGYDIENYCYNDSFICGRRYQESIKKSSGFDYYTELIKGTCFNFLYQYRTNYPTWQFTPKTVMGFNGWL